MRPAVGWSLSFLSISSPIGPSMTFSACVASRKTNGRLKTFGSGPGGPHWASADAGDRQGADLRLLDHLLLAAQLHGGVHLDAEAPVGGGRELLAHALHRLDGGIAERMHVRGLEHELGLAEGGGHLDRTH